uniref:Uncharacterized protein n=1 Tax=Arundo donax TaxID=35708 RepID=A0A0A9CG46_ARUDO
MDPAAAAWRPRPCFLRPLSSRPPPALLTWQPRPTRGRASPALPCALQSLLSSPLQLPCL